MSKMDLVFLDAGVFIGALLSGDPRHTEARPIVEAARRRIGGYFSPMELQLLGLNRCILGTSNLTFQKPIASGRLRECLLSLRDRLWGGRGDRL